MTITVWRPPQFNPVICRSKDIQASVMIIIENVASPLFLCSNKWLCFKSSFVKKKTDKHSENE